MWSRWKDERGSEVLVMAECRRLLASGAKHHLVGHLAIPGEDAPSVLPVDYTVFSPDILIRVGGRLAGRIADHLVGFEVDGVEDGRPWSVLVRGLARLVDAEAVGNRAPAPRVAEPGGCVVQIRSDVVTGRRLAKTAKA